MAVKGKSARGEIVDFDLIKIKEQMAAVPVSIDVQARRNFVEGRLRRTIRKKIPQGLVDRATKDINVDQQLPSVEGEVAKIIPPETTADAESLPSTTKQNARPKTQKKKITKE